MIEMTRKGFTLIELLVVVSIIAVLTSIGLAVFTSSQKKARDARRQADLEAVRSALELYRSDNPTVGYPAPAGAQGYNGLCCAAGTALRSYLSALSLDPKNGTTYFYSYTGGGTTYVLSAKQEVLTPANYQLTPP